MCVPLESYICVHEKCVSYSFHSFVSMATVMAYYVLYCIFIYKIQPIQKKRPYCKCVPIGSLLVPIVLVVSISHAFQMGSIFQTNTPFTYLSVDSFSSLPFLDSPETYSPSPSVPHPTLYHVP